MCFRAIELAGYGVFIHGYGVGKEEEEELQALGRALVPSFLVLGASINTPPRWRVRLTIIFVFFCFLFFWFGLNP